MGSTIIGIDHGYKNMKSENAMYATRLSRLDSKPDEMQMDGVIEFEGVYYTIYGSPLAAVNNHIKSGMIEAWGRGFEKIKEACALYEGSLPEYEISASGIMVLCKACDRYMSLLRDDGQHHVQSEQDNEQDIINKIVKYCREPRTTKEIVEYFGFANRLYFKRHYLDKMLADGILNMTIPEKPTSKNQKYYS